MPPELLDFLKNIGIVGGTVAIVWLLAKLAIKLIDFLRWFLDTIPNALTKFSQALTKIAETQTAHDTQITNLESATSHAWGELKTVIEGQGKIIESTIKSQDIRDEHLVSGLSDTATAIGVTAGDVKKNSNENADRIITEVQNFQKAIESEDGALRKDAKGHADRIIEAFQTLSTRNTELEAEVTTLKLAKQILETTTARLQDRNAGVASDDRDPTEPLTVMLSPVDGEVNREIIDAAKVEQPTGEPTK